MEKDFIYLVGEALSLELDEMDKVEYLTGNDGDQTAFRLKMLSGDKWTVSIAKEKQHSH